MRPNNLTTISDHIPGAAAEPVFGLRHHRPRHAAPHGKPQSLLLRPPLRRHDRRQRLRVSNHRLLLLGHRKVASGYKNLYFLRRNNSQLSAEPQLIVDYRCASESTSFCSHSVQSCVYPKTAIA